jgi:dienelactone hydrolase
MQTLDLDYAADGATMRGYLAYEDGAFPRPGVLVFHEGPGLGDFAMEKARQLASLGYVAFAADMFGARRQAKNLQEVATLVGALRAEPARLRERGFAALATLAGLPQVDRGRLAAIGFCFGGSVVLELARAGAELKAVVSFHGVLATKLPARQGEVRASVLVLTGAEDPLAPPDQVAAFEAEMRAAEVADWQLVNYGNTLHGFTNPAADGSMMRTALYHARSDRRSWRAMRAFLDEALA